jgi:peptidylprolyl isomerase
MRIRPISLTVFLAILPFTLITLTACTTDGGHPSTVAKSANKTGKVEKPMNSGTNPQIPAVSGAIGAMPVIAAPKGTPPTSLLVQDIVEGSGATVNANSTLTVHYTLMAWSTGKVVESSINGGSPATFPLANVIQGWQKGLPGMKVGGRRVLVIPPALAYGANGGGPIGPNETLIFVVDLLAIA